MGAEKNTVVKRVGRNCYRIWKNFYTGKAYRKIEAEANRELWGSFNFLK